MEPFGAGQPGSEVRGSPTRESPGGVEPQRTGNLKLAATVDSESNALEAQRDAMDLRVPHCRWEVERETP